MTKLEELEAMVEDARASCEVAYIAWDKAHTDFADAEADLNATYASFADAHNALKDELKKAEGQTDD